LMYLTPGTNLQGLLLYINLLQTVTINHISNHPTECTVFFENIHTYIRRMQTRINK
jgi:hypothetical protein